MAVCCLAANAAIVGILDLVKELMTVTYLSYLLEKTTLSEQGLSYSPERIEKMAALMLSVLQVMTAGLLIVAVTKGRRWLILPWCISTAILLCKEVVYVIYKLIMVSSNLYSARKTLNTSTSIIIDILELVTRIIFIWIVSKFFKQQNTKDQSDGSPAVADMAAGRNKRSTDRRCRALGRATTAV